MNDHLNPVRGTRGMAVAPHALASQSAVAIMREGGNAVEAMIAAAATIAVVYPHMNGIGGDGFWLISRPGEEPIGIEGCGAAALAACASVYHDAGFSSVPFRGPFAANTVAGTVSGWDAAYRWSADRLGGTIPLHRLLADAIDLARNGISVTKSQANCVESKRMELVDVPGFSGAFLDYGIAPKAGSMFRQLKLADTLEHLARAGLDDFYRGELARTMAEDLERVGSLIRLTDLQSHQALFTTPLVLQHSLGKIFNTPPPTQGLVSLLILGQLDRVLDRQMHPESAEFVHACVEASKLAFGIRDAHITDPAHMTINPQRLLDSKDLDLLANAISLKHAAPWGSGQGPADTVWLGAIDKNGVAVSFIQSIYHEFGSGVVLDRSGVNWQNRGASFSLDQASRNPLQPGRKPFHTLNPALARFDDGRTLVYGNMGGDGQPQSQSAVFTRMSLFDMHPAQAIDAPRWLLGRTWGRPSDSLKVEGRFAETEVLKLRQLGHDVEVLPNYDETMGHAGAIVRHPSGTFEGASDPRSDGAACSW